MSIRRLRRGGNAIEVALTMPVFLAAMFGLMDYAWYFYNEAMSIEATRQGCRVGSVVPGTSGDPEQEAYDFINAEIQQLGISGSLNKHTGGFSTSSGSVISVHVTAGQMLECDTYYTFNPLVGLVPTPDYVRSSSVFELEQPDA